MNLVDRYKPIQLCIKLNSVKFLPKKIIGAVYAISREPAPIYTLGSNPPPPRGRRGVAGTLHLHAPLSKEQFDYLQNPTDIETTAVNNLGATKAPGKCNFIGLEVLNQNYETSTSITFIARDVKRNEPS